MFRWLFPRKARANPEKVPRTTDAFDASELMHAEPVHVPLDGVLDLHTFRPEDAAEVVHEYVLACRQANVLQLRIVHGKGKGTLRRTVHAVLARMPEHVLRYELAERMRGGWGATLVDLRPDSATSARAEGGDGNEQSE